MQDNKFVDPRLQAREAIFQQLHLSTFETMGYARAIAQYVEETGHDIETDNADYQQLLRDYQITKNLAPIEGSRVEMLCVQTDASLNTNSQAHATYAQLCAAATSALNHWRILSEIPEDLRDNEEVTRALKDKFQQQVQTWEYILTDISDGQSDIE
jgi:DNA-binding helix-hairpin-helix protein with protein kinase domain